MLCQQLRVVLQHAVEHREHERVLLGVGGRPGRAPCRPSRTRRPCARASVASPPSSRIMFGPPPSGQRSACSVHHQYSSSVSPFHANTGTPRSSACRRADRDARPRGPGWRRCCSSPSAPRRRAATSVSMSTAVWIVMCSEPVMRAPASGWLAAYFARAAPSGRASRARPGRSPCGRTCASERSATLKSVPALSGLRAVVGLGGQSTERLLRRGGAPGRDAPRAWESARITG